MTREHIQNEIEKKLMAAYDSGTRHSPTDADRSEFYSPFFEFNVAPDIMKLVDQLLEEVAIDFAMFMKTEVLRLSDKKDNSRWRKIYIEWQTNKPK